MKTRVLGTLVFICLTRAGEQRLDNVLPSTKLVICCLTNVTARVTKPMEGNRDEILLQGGFGGRLIAAGSR
jgi:hypothetical protein